MNESMNELCGLGNPHWGDYMQAEVWMKKERVCEIWVKALQVQRPWGRGKLGREEEQQAGGQHGWVQGSQGESGKGWGQGLDQDEAQKDFTTFSTDSEAFMLTLWV